MYTNNKLSHSLSSFQFKKDHLGSLKFPPNAAVTIEMDQYNVVYWWIEKDKTVLFRSSTIFSSDTIQQIKWAKAKIK